VARKFKFGGVMHDVVCTQHLATLTQIWPAQSRCFHDGRKPANSRPQAVEQNPGISGEVAAWWLLTKCGNERLES